LTGVLARRIFFHRGLAPIWRVNLFFSPLNLNLTRLPEIQRAKKI